MPLTRYQVRNEYGLADPELYSAADDDEPEAFLEGIAMAGLVGILRQLGDLAEFAAEIFHGLHGEVVRTAARGHGLMVRVQRLEAEFPSIEKDILSETDQSSVFSKSGMGWHPNMRMEQNLIARENSPRCIMDCYEESREPPCLYLLDKFDVAGAGACLKRYSNPSFFKVESALSEISSFYVRREKREKRSQKLKKEGRKDRENPEIAPTSHAKLHQLFMHERIGSDCLDNACPLNLKREHFSESPLNSNSKRSYMEKLFQTPSPELQTIPKINVNPQALMSSEDNEVPDISIMDAIEDSYKRNEMEGLVCNMQELELTPSPDNLNCNASDRNMEIVSEPSTDCDKHEISPDPHKMMAEKILLNDGKEKQGRCLGINNCGDFTSGVDSFMDVHATMDNETYSENESRPTIELTHLNVGTHEIDSGRSEEKANLSQFPDGPSTGHGSVSEKSCSSFDEGRSSASNSNSLSSDLEIEPSDAEELASSSSSTETGIAETEDATFSHLSGNKEMAATTSPAPVYVGTEDNADGSIDNFEEEPSDSEELNTSSSSTENGIAVTEDAPFSQLSGNKEMGGTTSSTLVYIRTEDTDDGSIADLEEEQSDAEELALSSSSIETGIAETEGGTFSQLSENKEMAGTTLGALGTEDNDDGSIANFEEKPSYSEKSATSSSSTETGIAETEDTTFNQLSGNKEIAGTTSSALVYVKIEDTDDGSIANREKESFTCAENVSFMPLNPETNLFIGPKKLSMVEVEMNLSTPSVVSSVHPGTRNDPIFQDLAPEEKEWSALEDEAEEHGDRNRSKYMSEWERESGFLQSIISSLEAHITPSAKQEMVMNSDTLLLSMGSEIDTTIVAAIVEDGLQAEPDNTQITRDANLIIPSAVYVEETEFDQSSELEAVQLTHLPGDDASSKSLNIQSDYEKDLDVSPRKSPEGLSFQNPLFEVLRHSSLLPCSESLSEASQTSMSETPPLPPLPPVQWRIGKFQPADPDTIVTPFPTLPLFSPGNNNNSGLAPSGHVPQRSASILGQPSPNQPNGVVSVITPFENRDSILLAESNETHPSHDFRPAERNEEQATSNVSSPVSVKHVSTWKDLVSSQSLSDKGLSHPHSTSVPQSKSSEEQSQHVARGSNGQPANPSNSSCSQNVLSVHATCLAPPRPKNPVMDAVAVLDKSMLRKVSERVRPPPAPKVEEQDSLLEQIRNKSFNLRKTTGDSRPNIQVGLKTNLKIAAILEKANTIRKVTVGSDEDSDNWSDS